MRKLQLMRIISEVKNNTIIFHCLNSYISQDVNLKPTKVARRVPLPSLLCGSQGKQLSITLSLLAREEPGDNVWANSNSTK